MKIYSKRRCPICEKIISCAGAAWVGHSRVHVRDGTLEELLDFDGRITFRRIEKIKPKRLRKK